MIIRYYDDHALGLIKRLTIVITIPCLALAQGSRNVNKGSLVEQSGEHGTHNSPGITNRNLGTSESAAFDFLVALSLQTRWITFPWLPSGSVIGSL